MSSIFSLTRTALANRIIGSTDGAGTPLAIGANRAVLGWAKLAASDSEFYADLVTNGPRASVGLMKFDVDHTKTGPMNCDVHLYIAKPHHTAWTGQDISDLLASMKTRVFDQASYTGGAIVPEKMAIRGYDYEIEATPGIVVIQLNFEFVDPEPHEKVLPGPWKD